MKLNYKLTVLIGFAFMSILAFWQFYDQVIPYVLENVFGLSTFVSNAVMSVDNVLAVFMLPLFGILSDRTKTRLGKRMPYILFGTLAAVTLLSLMGVFVEKRSAVPFFVSLLALLVVMSVYRTPAVAYMPDVTEKPLRSKGNAVINLVGYIGGIFSTVVMMFLLKSAKDAEGNTVYAEGQPFLPTFLVVAAFMLISVLILTFTIRENKLVHVADNDYGEDGGSASSDKMPRPVRTSLFLILASVFLWFAAYNAVSTAFSRYCVEVWGADLSVSSGYLLCGTVAAIAAFVPLGFLSDKIGRKMTVLAGILLMTVCYGVAFFLNHQTPFMYVIFALVGIGWAAINVNSFPMVVEMCGGGNLGKYTGFYYTFSMTAQIATPLLSGFLIDHFPAGYKILFPYAVIFAGASFVTMLFVRHGDSKQIKKSSLLEHFDVGD